MEKISPLKAIRNNCIECSGGSKSEADNCHLTKCPLWPFRKGRNPFTKRTLTEEQRQAAAERLRKIRQENNK